MAEKGILARALAGMILATGILGAAVAAADSVPDGKVIGILTSKSDYYISVKADGAKESKRYVLDAHVSLKDVYVSNLVEIAWESRNDKAMLTSIRAIVPEQKSGTVTGTVTATAANAIDVKPDGRGFTECYWPRWSGGTFDEAMRSAFANLKAGDKVKVTWTYDERKRATQLEVIAPGPATTPKQSL